MMQDPLLQLQMSIDMMQRAGMRVPQVAPPKIPERGADPRRFDIRPQSPSQTIQEEPGDPMDLLRRQSQAAALPPPPRAGGPGSNLTDVLAAAGGGLTANRQPAGPVASFVAGLGGALQSGGLSKRAREAAASDSDIAAEERAYNRSRDLVADQRFERTEARLDDAQALERERWIEEVKRKNGMSLTFEERTELQRAINDDPVSRALTLMIQDEIDDEKAAKLLQQLDKRQKVLTERLTTGREPEKAGATGDAKIAKILARVPGDGSKAAPYQPKNDKQRAAIPEGTIYEWPPGSGKYLERNLGGAGGPP